MSGKNEKRSGVLCEDPNWIKLYEAVKCVYRMIAVELNSDEKKRELSDVSEMFTRTASNFRFTSDHLTVFIADVF